MYFRKRNGLLVRIDRRAVEAGLEVNKEYVYSDYKELSGVLLPTKAVVTVNGRKVTEMTISNYTFPAKIDASEFKKP